MHVIFQNTLKFIFMLPFLFLIFRKEDDGEIIRELPATGPGIKRAQPLLRYLVTVVTGDKRGAGTNADVFCCIYGDQGDTGDRPLLESKKNLDKFERNNVSRKLFLNCFYYCCKHK